MFADVAEGTRDAITRVGDGHFTRFTPVSTLPPVFHKNSAITDALSS